LSLSYFFFFFYSFCISRCLPLWPQNNTSSFWPLGLFQIEIIIETPKDPGEVLD